MALGREMLKVSEYLQWRKLVKGVKVIAGEECSPKHRLVLCDLTLKTLLQETLCS